MTEPMKTDEWNASPKKKKPLVDKLNDLSKKIHKAERAVRNEKGEIIGMVPFEIYNTIRIQEVAAERERIKKAIESKKFGGEFPDWDGGYNSACDDIIELIDSL